MTSELYGRSLLAPDDLTAEEFLGLVALADRLRRERREDRGLRQLQGRTLALVFEKSSTRTRSAFEVAAHHQGAHVTYLGPQDSQLGHKESPKDTARVLGRMFDGIEYRGFAQTIVETLAEFAGVPVWNGLTDQWHPTQMLADVLTITERFARPLPELTLCYLGDGRNNTAHSLLVTGALLGMDIRIAAPAGLQPSADVRERAARLASASGATVLITDDPYMAVKGADVLYTDVWVSMGEPLEVWDERISLLRPYQVDAAMVAATGREWTIFMHCLPALHDLATDLGRDVAARAGLTALEVTDDVFESAASVVFDQAENRLHTIEALLVATLVR